MCRLILIAHNFGIDSHNICGIPASYQTDTLTISYKKNDHPSQSLIYKLLPTSAFCCLPFFLMHVTMHRCACYCFLPFLQPSHDSSQTDEPK